MLLGVLVGWGAVLHSPLVVVTWLVLLATGFSILRQPEAGVLAFVAVANLLPFGVIPIRFGLSFTMVDFLVTTLLVAWLFWAIHRGRPLVTSALDGLVLLYLGLAVTAFVLGLTYSIPPERARLFLKSLNSILLFFSVLNCVRTRVALNRAVTALLVCGAGAAGIALAVHSLPNALAIQLLSSLGELGYPTGPGVLRPIADTEILRAIGTSIDPNVLGGLLMLASVLMVGQIFSPRPLLERRWLWPMLLATAAALLLTQSRSALGGAVVGAVIVGVFRDRRVLLLMLLAVLLMPLVPQASVLLDRLQTGLSFQDRAAAMRLDEYQNALNTIARYPWFGIGFGETPSIDLFLGVSSIYLLVGQEMGLVGLASFLVVLGALAWQVAVGLRAGGDEESRGVLLSLGAALSAAAAEGLLDHYFVNITFPHMVGLFWLYAGLAVVAARGDGGRRRHVPLTSPVP